ncbi:IS5 family transposase [Deinococcus malanensis]|uniref:IS5 family transposase n=1 Tax=Deinococcus malanensis TaxID=1706855 RepID=UPI003644527D
MSFVSDPLWTLIKPLLPISLERPKGGRPRIADRLALEGILFVLHTGISWRFLPQQLGYGSGMTCWRRLLEWQQAGIWADLHRCVLDHLHAAGVVDWSHASLDSASVPAPCGGKQTGRDPTNRGKLGTKRHLVVDRSGLPLAVVISASNVHDSKMLEAAIDAVPGLRNGKGGQPRKRPTKLHADKGYDYTRCRHALYVRGSCPVLRDVAWTSAGLSVR